MPEITFYILPSHSQQERHLFACKLTEKAYRGGHYGYILAESEQQSRLLDDLLWTFRPGSFVPHQIDQNPHPATARSVLIGGNPVPETRRSLVLNLSSELPKPFEKCERILEILDSRDENRQTGRNRYRAYQNAGCIITTHKM